jgi:hypothetical protein
MRYGRLCGPSLSNSAAPGFGWAILTMNAMFAITPTTPSALQHMIHVLADCVWSGVGTLVEVGM